ncbi:MAG: iron hydrogenase [Ignavibacteriales bacterium]|nr:iron hydrogenase [Ignavibacteriales bacterium]
MEVTTIQKTTQEGSLLLGDYSPGSGVEKALEIGRESILFELKASKLKGRGGAGFPTSTKWMLTAAAKSEEKFVVCNADEGEPGTFKDRVLLLEHPDLVFDGMIVGGYTVGAKKGLVYLRGEYYYMYEYLLKKLEAMRQEGRLGEKINGVEGFNFDIEIRLGSGAYVCGEETALIESLEGHRGEPRNRPPFPVNTGFFGRPTTVNNVETLATVPHILLMGGEKYATQGTNKSTGTKLFSISGDVERPGVYELDWGSTVNDVLKLVGGENAKAVQVGGASGKCVPRSRFDEEIAYESLTTGGSIMVFGPQRKMIDVLENFMEFFAEESCGQCTPCRVGNRKLLEGVKMIKAGDYRFTYVAKLKDLGRSMQVASKCGLGQSSPNPFISILENFKDEIFHSKGNGKS